MPTLHSGGGNSDEIIVPMTSVITSGMREGSLGTAAVQNGRAGPIPLRRYEGNHMPNKWSTDKQHSNGSQGAKACIGQYCRKGCCDVVSLCLKPYWGNPVVRNCAPRNIHG